MDIPMQAIMKPTLPWLILAASVLMFGSAGCKRNRSKADATIEEAAPSQTEQIMIRANDPAASAQLIKGFHTLEQGRYRWTMGQFSVLLRPPVHASERGARLILQLGIPESSIQKLKSMKLSASVEGVALPEETYTKSGGFFYSRDVPPQALAKRVVTVNFKLDKCLPPGDSDRRELGVVMTEVGFEAK
jgi:hypothetical protein